MWSFSRSSTFCDTNMGKYAFSTPISLIFALNHSSWSLQISLISRVGREAVTLDNFPYTVRPWFEDVASTDAVVIEHIRLDQNLHRVDI
jgi:hypothetical protein